VAGLGVVIVGIWLYWKIKTRAAPPSTRPISMTAEFVNAAYSSMCNWVFLWWWFLSLFGIFCSKGGGGDCTVSYTNL